MGNWNHTINVVFRGSAAFQCSTNFKKKLFLPLFRLHKKRPLKWKFSSKWTIAFLRFACCHSHQQCKNVPVCKGGLAVRVSTWERGTTEKKFVPDETGSREWRQRKGCLGQGKERTALSLDTQAKFTPCGMKEKCFFSYSYPFSCHDYHPPFLFSSPLICVQMPFLSFAHHMCAKANCISHHMIIYTVTSDS